MTSNQYRLLDVILNHVQLENVAVISFFHGGWVYCLRQRGSKSAGASLDLLTFVWLCQQ